MLIKRYHPSILLPYVCIIVCITCMCVHYFHHQSGILSEKEVKKLGFQRCELRFGELAPLLQRLDELDLQQREGEEGNHATFVKGKKKSSEGSSSSSSNSNRSKNSGPLKSSAGRR